jgi:anti-sigma-K factor RskA
MNENMQEVMLDLLCKKAEYGLSEHEEQQLSVLQSSAGTGDLSTSFELATATLAMADLDTSEEMPEHLRSRIVADAEKYFKANPTVPEPTTRGSIFGWLGWAVAAAACVALALNLYLTRPPTNVVNRPGTPTPTPEQKLTPSQMRQALILSAPDLARATLGAGEINALKPTGDIVWSDSKQAGYVRLSGLPRNDPSKETYQLWIVAENQDPKTPVDGGTFDISSDGEIIIPIDAKVKVQNPQVFAITIEKPGGVVVSKNKHAAVGKRET